MKRSRILNKIHTDYNFVVEIGAGPIPFNQTNLIIDKHPFDNIERWDDIELVAPLIKGDARSLPFSDKSIDLLFMSQVIEHVENPLEFLKEAKRVTKDIYIECPSIIRESIYGWSFHRWVIQTSNNKWTFYKNDLPQLCSDHFHNEQDIFFMEYTNNQFDKFNNYYYGTIEKLEFEISDISAFDYLSTMNQQKVNFPNLTENYKYFDKIKALPYFLFKNLLPNRIKSLLKKSLATLKQSTLNQKNSFNKIKDKFICLKCKRTLKTIHSKCQCGFTVKKINGIFSLDLDDY